jgi:transcription termination/antitermination protein NusA
MKNEFVLAFNEVLEEKQLPREVVLEALEAAMVSAYRRAVMASNAQQIEAKINPENGNVVIYAEKEVVDSVQDERTEVALEDALKVDPEAEIGGMVLVESTPKDFGRVAAQTARQVIQQRIREAERDTQLQHFSKQVGEIVSGVIQAITPQGVALGLDMKAEGLLPRNHQIPYERFRVHDRIQALLLEVKEASKGPQIILSRSHRNFLRRLLENEVPEIYHGLVEIRSIAREPGHRSKVAVAALQPAVDPVGACVGIRGVRIQAIVRELNDEKIDVIEWDPDPASYIAKALSPARVTGVYLNEFAKGTKTATVVVPEDQLSLAIGRDGQNARLAAKLTSWRIDIKSLPEATADALHKIQQDPEYSFLHESENEVIPQIEFILTKKSEGRPVTPEEYQVLSQFVDRVERTVIRQISDERRLEEERRQAAIGLVPEQAFEVQIEELNLPARVSTILEAEYKTAGDLILQMKLDSDKILGLNGIGPKSMQEIEKAINSLEFPEIIEEPLVEPEESTLPEAEVIESVGIQDLIEETKEIEVEIEEEPLREGEELPQEVEPESILVSLEPSEVAPGVPAETIEKEDVEIIEDKGPIEEAEIAHDVEAEEIPSSFDDLFTLKPDTIEFPEELVEEEEEEEGPDKKRSKKKKKRKRYVEMEYDPERDAVIVKRKRKRGGDDWEEDWKI